MNITSISKTNNIEEVIIDNYASSTIFSSEPIRTQYFLSKCVKSCNDSRLSLTHLFFAENKELIGFITLTMGKLERRSKNIHWPLLKIDQLSVKDNERESWKSKTFDFIIKFSVKIAQMIADNHAGCKYVLVEVEKKDEIIYLFNKYGFSIIDGSFGIKSEDIERMDGISKKKLIKMLFPLPQLQIS